MVRKTAMFLAIILFSFLKSQDFYSELRKKYYIYEGNDLRAFVYLDIYIATAKKQKNYGELFQAYDDAIKFSPDKKLIYADSAIAAAGLSKNKDLIGSSHINKGVVYYFTYRKFQSALDEYLKAFEYLKRSDDQFLKHQNLYHIGVVKSYLGYYDEALLIFSECAKYFEQNTKYHIHPNLVINNQKGYLNTLHQMIVCYQALEDKKKVDQLIIEGVKKTPKTSFFYLEKSYLEKAKGISAFDKKKFDEALKYLDLSLTGLKKKNDFTWVSVVYYYKGKSFEKLGKSNMAVENFKKVDSIFNKYHFILPELRDNYEQLINHYKEYPDTAQELYFTKQLLKADEIISNDFKHLSSRIHKDYDTKELLESKADLEDNNSYSKYLLFLFAAIILTLTAILLTWFRRKKEVQKKYDDLLTRIKKEDDKEHSIVVEQNIDRNSKLDEKLLVILEKKLSEFERCEGFLEKGITASKLAGDFHTNTSYLSQFINEYKLSNFNTYINTLRINYATHKIYNDKEWRKYSVEDIASLSGFSNRQSFSNIFFEQNGIRPADFIKKRKKELISNISDAGHIYSTLEH